MTDREALDIILSKLSGIEESIQRLEKGQRQTQEQIKNLAADMDGKITGLYRHVTQETGAIRAQLDRVEDSMKYLAGDVYFLKRETGGGNG